MYSRELVAASTLPMILSILSEGRSYGYLIIKRVKELSGGQMEWKEAMLYPVLKKLEREGFISSSWVLSEEGRNRKYYDITDTGKAFLHQRKNEWHALNSLFTEMWASHD